MAPKVDATTQITGTKRYGVTTPNEFDFSKIEIGNLLANSNAPENESFLRKYLNYVQAHNAPIKEQLKNGKAELKEIKREVYNLELACKNADTLEEQAMLKGQLRDAKSLQWLQIRKNIKLAFSLA